jgi:hypothetical protein
MVIAPPWGASSRAFAVVRHGLLHHSRDDNKNDAAEDGCDQYLFRNTYWAVHSGNMRPFQPGATAALIHLTHYLSLHPTERPWEGHPAPLHLRIASNRARMAALPSSTTAAGSRPSCRYSPGLRRAACARMIAARCGPRRANLDAIEKARGQSPARIAACTWKSLVCNPASCGRRLYTERARISRRDMGVFSQHIRPGKAKGALCGGWGAGALPLWRGILRSSIFALNWLSALLTRY